MKLILFVAAVLAGLSLIASTEAKRSAHAGKPVPSGTIAIAAGYTPALGDDLLFDYTVEDIGNQNPRIQVLCYQDVNESGIVSRTEDLDGNGYADDLVYGEARDAEPNSSVNSQPFAPLGGGSSPWLNNGGGPAECDTTLYYWDFHPVQTFIPLAEITFSAGG